MREGGWQLKVEDRKRGKLKDRVGKVVKKSGDKSILVEVTRRVKHPVYGKILKKRKRFMVHDEENMAQIGDLIKFVDSRPFSKRKRWRIVTIGKKRET
ncbi:30S ribosomal protein S17 [candidate division WOR-3 bacterium]|nr:30S ribosomal protein S17 [candidate division WOR-3 bacterium]MCK4575222.1 30S ribosomal protein S17 [candidate division WOR-3 bacterium]